MKTISHFACILLMLAGVLNNYRQDRIMEYSISAQWLVVQVLTTCIAASSSCWWTKQLREYDCIYILFYYFISSLFFHLKHSSQILIIINSFSWVDRYLVHSPLVHFPWIEPCYLNSWKVNPPLPMPNTLGPNTEAARIIYVLCTIPHIIYWQCKFQIYTALVADA